MLHKKISFPDSFRLFFLRAKKAGWAASEGFVSPILQLALTPFLLHELGKVEFGTWVLVLTFWSLGPLLSFAAAVATFNRLSELVAGDDKSGLVQAFKTGVLLGVGATLLSFVVLGVVFVVYAFLFGNEVRYHHAVPLVLLAGVVLLVQEIDNIFSSALKAHSRFDLVAKIDISFRVLWVSSVALSAAWFDSAFACVFAAVFVALFKSAVKFNVVHRLLGRPSYIFCAQQYFWDKKVSALAAWNWGQAIGGALFNAADKFLVGALFGLEVLSSYSICSQVAQFVHGIQASAAQVLLPWSSRHWVGATSDTMKKFRRVAFWGGLGCLILPLIVAAGMPYILGFWIGDDFARANIVLAYALLVGYASLSLNVPLHYILLGGGHIKILTVLNLLGGGLSVLLGIGLSNFGVAYFALSKCVYSPVTLIALKNLRNSSRGDQ